MMFSAKIQPDHDIISPSIVPASVPAMIRFFVIALLAFMPLEALGTSELGREQGNAQSIHRTPELTLA